MFRYFWPEEVVCEKCLVARMGSTLYISEEPVYSVCGVCDASAHRDAVKYAANLLTEEDYANGWEWFETGSPAPAQNRLFSRRK